MTRDEVYKQLMDKAIENKVELSDKAYNVAGFRAMANIGLDKCACCIHNQERYCISPKCLKDIQENGICSCRVFKKFGN